jgi:hypothetical protein
MHVCVSVYAYTCISCTYVLRHVGPADTMHMCVRACMYVYSASEGTMTPVDSDVCVRKHMLSTCMYACVHMHTYIQAVA